MTEINDARESTMTRVASRDGTEIAYWTSGNGPPLVLVHGAPADHTRWSPLLPYLEAHATVHAMDRRGRGASGDAPDYALAREFEDVAAVVDAVAEASRSAVDVYGHSYGGIVAFGAANVTSNIRKLVLYEGWPVPNPEVFALPPGVEEQVDALLARGDHEAIVETVFRAALLMDDEELAGLRALPSWQGRIASAHALPRELRACVEAALDAEQAARISVPTLLMTGEVSPDPSKAAIDAVAAALPDVRTVVLEGQEHVADILGPEVFAEHLFAFLRE
jgi:pimeloyl-ACP methyl ester carboxylesterase